MRDVFFIVIMLCSLFSNVVYSSEYPEITKKKPVLSPIPQPFPIPPKPIILKNRALRFLVQNSFNRFIDINENSNIKLFLDRSYINHSSPNEGFLNESTGNECGPVAAHNILKWYGRLATVSSLSRDLNTDHWAPEPLANLGIELAGTNTDNMRRVLAEKIPRGHRVKYGHGAGNLDRIRKPLEKGYPVMVNYRSAPQMSHWAIIVGIDYKYNKKDPVLIFANASRMSWVEFKKRWEKRWVIGNFDSNLVFPFFNENKYTMLYIENRNRPSNWVKEVFKSVPRRFRRRTFTARNLGEFNPILPPETPVWKINLRIETADVENAVTNSRVYVSFKDEWVIDDDHPAGHMVEKRFYLNTGWNDFSSNNSVQHTSYSIAPASFGVYELGDIEKMKIGIEGEDGLGIRKISMSINDDNQFMFQKYYGNTSSTCKWIDKNNSSFLDHVLFTRAELMAYNGMYLKDHMNAILPPQKITGYDLRHMIETNLGDQLYSNEDMREAGIKWMLQGSKAVEFGGDATSSSVGLDIDLKKEGRMEWKGMHVDYTATLDVDFDLRISCIDSDEGGKVVMLETTNADIEVTHVKLPNWVKAAQYFLFGISDLVRDLFNQTTINDLLFEAANVIADQEEHNLLSSTHINTPYCPEVYFNDNRDLIIKYDSKIEYFINMLRQ